MTFDELPGTAGNAPDGPVRRWQSPEGYRICRVFRAAGIRFVAWPPRPTYQKHASDWRVNLHSPLGTEIDLQSAITLCRNHQGGKSQ